MSGATEQGRQADFVLAPRAGKIASVAVSNVAASLDLSTVDNTTKDPTDADKLSVGLVGCYATFLSDGGDSYVIFGPSSASVTGANAPVIATNGTNAAGVCFKLPANIPFNFKITSQDQFVGYISGATAQLRIYRSSPYSQAC